MTPVEQTCYGKGQGNCLTACVASLIDVPIDSLPEFCVDGEWFGRLVEFCEKNGFSVLYWKHSELVPMVCIGTNLILLLDLEGTDELHAVVGKTVFDYKEPDTASGGTRWAWKTEIIHDPNKRYIPPVKRVSGYIVIART